MTSNPPPSVADRIGSATLALLATFNVLLVVLLLLTIAAVSARAGDLPACTGANLLDKLAADDPAAHAAVLEEGEKAVFGDTVLFRIERQGTDPSWLFGTIHMTDPRVKALPPFVHDALDRAKTVAIEATEVLDPQQMQMAIVANHRLTMLQDGQVLGDLLSPEQLAEVEKGLSGRGLPMMAAERMKPWLLLSVLAMPECEIARQAAGLPFLDIALARQAQADGKALVGLETIVEQFEAMAAMPMELQVQAVADMAMMPDHVDDMIETMIVLYTEGRIGLIWPATHAASAMLGYEYADMDDYASFEERLITARNRTMAERAMPLLEQGGAFIAVGALHLPGQEGLARLFEQAGYTVTPVYQ